MQIIFDDGNGFVFGLSTLVSGGISIRTTQEETYATNGFEDENTTHDFIFSPNEAKRLATMLNTMADETILKVSEPSPLVHTDENGINRRVTP